MGYFSLLGFESFIGVVDSGKFRTLPHDNVTGDKYQDVMAMEFYSCLEMREMVEKSGFNIMEACKSLCSTVLTITQLSTFVCLAV
jgi:hypothetical protein